MISLDFKSVKANFFDRKKVTDALDKGTKGALNEAGRRVRKIAQQSLAYGKNVSRPGQPPTAHKTGVRRRVSRKTGKVRVRSVSYLREFLFYSYDPPSRSVVVGPVRLNATVDARSLPALEYGGSSTAIDHGVPVPIRVRARPFMGPALEQAAPGLPALWANSVR